MNNTGPYVKCNITGLSLFLKNVSGSYHCTECEGNDRQEAYYSNHSVIQEKEKYSVDINSGHFIEIMDRLHVAIDTISDHIESHPIVCANEGIRKDIRAAIESLNSAYQHTGTEELFFNIEVDK